MQFYLYQNDQQVGPYTESQIREMLSSGSIQENDACWHEGCTEWRPVSTILGITDLEAQPTPLPIRQPTETIVKSPKGPISLPSWAAYALPAIAALILGYFLGREHLKYQMKSAISDMASSVSQGIKDAFSNTPETPAASISKLEIGQTHQVDNLSITLTGAKIALPKIKRGLWGDDEQTGKEPKLILSFTIVNNDERKIKKFIRDGAFKLQDDVDNRVHEEYAEAAGGLGKYNEILPNSTVSHIELFDIPLPKTEFLQLTIDLERFDGEGKVQFKIPSTSIEK